jgi:hypothetical protein
MPSLPGESDSAGPLSSTPRLRPGVAIASPVQPLAFRAEEGPFV